MKTNTPLVLLCTVGGSHQPIVTAIRESKPDFVLFICTGRDPGTGKSGSEVQISGGGNVIKELGLATEQFQVLIVPSDDLDQAFARIHAKISELAKRFPDAEIVADYTGGTKTMTAALVTAALESDGIQLQLVTGSRADLVKVRDGTQRPAFAAVEGIRLRRAMAPFLSAWSRYAYEEAAAGLAAIRSPGDSEYRAGLDRARELSRGFAAWDRFEHSAALSILKDYGAVIGADLQQHIAALWVLDSEGAKKEPMQLFDLWRNAERRAAQGRYDDAVSRVYRLIEWTAQWLLRTRSGIDTADVAREVLPGGFTLSANRDGKIQMGLFAAWQLVEAKLPGSAAARFFATEREALLDHLKARNSSVLAHGKLPIGEARWAIIKSWIDVSFLPMLKEEAESVGVRSIPPQLPREYLWEST